VSEGGLYTFMSSPSSSQSCDLIIEVGGGEGIERIMLSLHSLLLLS
jgi:hypothetical protein